MFKFEKKHKYLVLKLDDLREALSVDQKAELTKVIDTVNGYRHDLGKGDNSYVVVNEDEPYSPIVWGLIEMVEKVRKEGMRGHSD